MALVRGSRRAIGRGWRSLAVGQARLRHRTRAAPVGAAPLRPVTTPPDTCSNSLRCVRGERTLLQQRASERAMLYYRSTVGPTRGSTTVQPYESLSPPRFSPQLVGSLHGGESRHSAPSHCHASGWPTPAAACLSTTPELGCQPCCW